MSSCSNAVPVPFLTGCTDETARTRARVLAGIAWECSALANEISELGAGLSAERIALDEPHRMMQLQSFDRLMQYAHVQAQIVAHLARDILMGRASGVPQMLEVIDAIPLHDVRTRLREALGAVPSHAHGESGTADLWD